MDDRRRHPPSLTVTPSTARFTAAATLKMNQATASCTTLGMSASNTNEEEDDGSYKPVPFRNRSSPWGGDMAYAQTNILRQVDHYTKIRQAGGLECVNDVYVCNVEFQPKNLMKKKKSFYPFWFVGKIARCTGTVTINQAIARQLNLIEEHATRLRPVELGRSYGKLQIWTAPGDTELEMSCNNPNIKLTRMERYVEGCEDIPNVEVGFNAEVVANRGVGFCVQRTGEGIVPPHLIGLVNNDDDEEEMI